MDKTKTFLGVHLPPADYLAFRVTAAQQGKSAAKLLRELAIEAIGSGAKAPKKKGGAK